MKRVRLDYGHDVTITDEAFAQIDPINVVYFTTTGSRDPQRDWYYTLLYWGFPVPLTWQDGEETKEINHHHWSIEGNVKTDQVIFIKNSLDYGSERSVDFLSWKDGRTLQIDRRKGEGRRLFLAARKRIEETKDERGGYH